MRNRRCAVLLVCTILPLIVAAGAFGSTSKPARVLKLVSRGNEFTMVGFPADKSQPPPVGAGYLLQTALFNRTAQFGKPTGARVGSVELQCVLASSLRTLCTGVAHLPDGFITLTGANLTEGGPTEWYAATGGVSAYANRHGQIKATDVGGQNANKTIVTITLYG